MSSQGSAPVILAAVSRDRRLAILLVAFAVAILTQILLASAFGSRSGAARDHWSLSLALFGLLTVSGGLVVWAVWKARDMAVRWGLVAAIAITGLLMRLPFFGTGPMLEDDHYRYLLDGAMVANGFNPYRWSPERLLAESPPALSAFVEAGRGAIEAINFPDLRSVYPGSAQALFALAHAIAPWSIDGLRLVMGAAEIATALLIWHVLRQNGGPMIAVALYWCNPLMAFSLTGQAHIDAAPAPMILLALLAAGAKRGAGAGIALGLAVGIKLWPVLLAPLLARALWPDRRELLLFAVALGSVTLLTCGPLIWASLSANAGLTAYAGGWSINNAPFAWLSYVFLHVIGPGSGEMILRALVVVIAGGVSLAAGLHAVPDQAGLIGRAAFVAAWLFYLSPAQFPWYSAWFLPLAAASGAWVLAFGAVGLPVYFLFFPLAAAGLRDLHGYGLAGIHLLPLLGAILLHRRLTLREAPR